ncbi:hypothetical protein [Corynebacterium sp. HMSC29G08]|uniref:hypothetical protein n=1 Tax=Corynebacterium sp. HMSC29G08 TaxID=1581069 RepID=UPI0008A1E6EF|nr:hypothetical protein [Corynebacterium sp. HMSC29G08]OFT80716.1 hypothetical protein HMPREF3101_11485 [Corynebacterium sp. HMSC29G08]
MARSIRSRRVTLAAGVLSFALVAPLVVAPEGTTPLLPVAHAQTADAFAQRYTTANFWGVDEAVVEGLELAPGTTIAATTDTIFNWHFRNDNGTLVLIRPQSPAAFRAGEHNIRVKVTPENGTSYTTTLKVNVVDARTTQTWEDQLLKTYDIDFGKSAAPKPLTEFTLPEGVNITKGTVAPPPGWGVTVEGGTVTIKPPATFIEGFIELPVKVTTSSDTFDAKLRINARNPQTSATDVANGIAGTVGTLLGGIVGAPDLGNILGGLIGGGTGGGTTTPATTAAPEPTKPVEPTTAAPTTTVEPTTAAPTTTATSTEAPGAGEDPSSGAPSSLSDPRCVASLAGIGVPLLLAVPVALAQAAAIPGFEDLSAQFSQAIEDAARNFGIQPQDASTAAGGVVGVILAIAAAIAVATCVPRDGK